MQLYLTSHGSLATKRATPASGSSHDSIIQDYPVYWIQL